MIVVIATDAPLSDRNLRRLASRAMMGLGRTGSSASNGSGDYVIAFSTAESVRRAFGGQRLETSELPNDRMSALFQASVDAVEESVYNALTMAMSENGNGVTVEALPLEQVRAILRRHGAGLAADRWNIPFSQPDAPDLELPEGASTAKTNAALEFVEAKLKAYPEVESVMRRFESARPSPPARRS